MKHGSDSTYTNHGCRCQACRDAHAIKQWDANQTRARRLATNPDLPVEHGKYATYNNWGCRCTHCIDAARRHWRDASRRYRNKRAA